MEKDDIRLSIIQILFIFKRQSIAEYKKRFSELKNQIKSQAIDLTRSMTSEHIQDVVELKKN